MAPTHRHQPGRVPGPTARRREVRPVSSTSVSRRTAVHEAGHAIAVVLHNGRLTYVSAVPDPNAERWGGLCSWVHARDCDTCDPIAEATIALAGPTAEGIYATSTIAAADTAGRVDIVHADELRPATDPNDLLAATAARWDMRDGHT